MKCCFPYFFFQAHVEGRRCDSCRHGFHTLEQRNSLGCLPCVCDISGTVPGGVCDTQTGQCPCKEGVEGVQCTNCAHNYYNSTLDRESKRTQKWDLNPVLLHINFFHSVTWSKIVKKLCLCVNLFSSSAVVLCPVRGFLPRLCTLHVWP